MRIIQIAPDNHGGLYALTYDSRIFYTNEIVKPRLWVELPRVDQDETFVMSKEKHSG